MKIFERARATGQADSIVAKTRALLLVESNYWGDGDLSSVCRMSRFVSLDNVVQAFLTRTMTKRASYKYDMTMLLLAL